MSAHEFAARLRGRERLLGYWSVLDSPVSTEWLAHIGWDYIALDMQHGLIGYSGMVAGLTAIDASGSTVGLVRVEANDAAAIGRALDAGAAGVIVPMVNNACRSRESGCRGDVSASGCSVVWADAVAAADRPAAR